MKKVGENLIDWRENVKITKTNRKKKKKEEYQLFLESNNSYRVIQFFHIHSLFYKLDISLLSSSFHSFQRITKKRRKKMKKTKKRGEKEKKKEKKKNFEEERVC